jgi:hypothetical protein
LIAETAHTNMSGRRIAGCPAVIEIGGIIYRTMIKRK